VAPNFPTLTPQARRRRRRSTPTAPSTSPCSGAHWQSASEAWPPLPRLRTAQTTAPRTALPARALSATAAPTAPPRLAAAPCFRAPRARSFRSLDPRTMAISLPQDARVRTAGRVRAATYVRARARAPPRTPLSRPSGPVLSLEVRQAWAGTTRWCATPARACMRPDR
jgi:hypothetical protein